MAAKPDTEPAFYREDPAEIGAPGNKRRRALVMVVLATLFAASIGAVVFLFVLTADFLTAPSRSVVEFMFEHSALAVSAALSPLFAALLVGYGYMQRAIRRRAEQKAPSAPSSPPGPTSAGPSGVPAEGVR